MKLYLFVVFVILLTVGNIQAQECDAILRDGVFNRKVFQETRSSKYVLAAELTRLSASEARSKLGLGVNFVIEGLPLGGSFTDEQFESWKEQVRQRIDINSVLQNSISIILSEADPTLIGAWESCVTYGLYSYLKALDDTNLTYVVKWKPYPGTEGIYPEIRSFQVTGATINASEQTVVATGNKIGIGGIAIQLQRPAKGAVVVTLNTSVKPCIGFVPKEVALPVIPETKLIANSGLYVGHTPNCNAAIVANNPNHLNCVNTFIGYTIKQSEASQQELYYGNVQDVNAGVVTTKSRFRNGTTTPMGFTVKEAFKKPGAIPLYVVTGCGDNDGEVTTNPSHKNCPTIFIGWTYPATP